MVKLTLLDGSTIGIARSHVVAVMRAEQGGNAVGCVVVTVAGKYVVSQAIDEVLEALHG